MAGESTASVAVQAVHDGVLAFCKFLSANDTGKTGGHQAGIYIPKPAVPIIFSQSYTRGANHDRRGEIIWHDGKTTCNRFIYYGRGTRNEYRITQFGRGFEYLSDEHTGDLFVLVKITQDSYQGFILSTEEDIEEFLAAFSMSPSDTGRLISYSQVSKDMGEIQLFQNFFNSLTEDFPSTGLMAEKAREIEGFLYNQDQEVKNNPDKKLLSWIEIEYKLFRFIENIRFNNTNNSAYGSIDDFIAVALTYINRRKSRAGKSLEHHLSYIFKSNNLRFSEQTTTEGKVKPDFIFPGKAEYLNKQWPLERLIFLAAKTTCKDRWRQILNEADRISTKHLFTLQQGISSEQLKEMEKNQVKLVVPQKYISTFPKAHQGNILTLKEFIEMVASNCSESNL
ncbi:MAG: type II restriction endonuclease [Anaerolineaceae bacterium]